MEAAAEVARLQVVVANAEQRRLEAEKQLAEVQERFKYRTLTAEQKTKLLDILSASAVKGEVRVEFVGNSDESRSFADQFVEVLTKAGWKPKKIGVVPSFGVNKGLFVIVDDEHSVAGFALYSALKDSGVDFTSDVNNRWPKGTVTLHVGLKP